LLNLSKFKIESNIKHGRNYVLTLRGNALQLMNASLRQQDYTIKIFNNETVIDFKDKNGNEIWHDKRCH
jgi:hypothetical protein